MLVLLKFLQSLVKTLHSEGTPVQIGLGFALGASLGLTPLFNAHNLVVIVLLALLNVSFGAGLLAMAVFAAVGYLLDPVFDRIGRALLVDAPSLRPMWERLENTPTLALTNLNNTIVLGSVVAWIALFVPIFALGFFGVKYYRAT